MFGNRFKSDEIAREFRNQLEKNKKIKKMASAPAVKPEDFLVESEEAVDSSTQALESKIEEVSSYVKDECECCHKPMESCVCDQEHKEASDFSFLIDKKAEYVLKELGKIAAELRKENKGFAADMVEVTAIDIKNDEIRKASEKLTVINELKKMASAAYKDGDIMTGDVINVTIENIKKSS